jgi:hypothetical protein
MPGMDLQHHYRLCQWLNHLIIVALLVATDCPLLLPTALVSMTTSLDTM